MTLLALAQRYAWPLVPLFQRPSTTWAQIKAAWSQTETERGCKAALRMHGEGVTAKELFAMHEACMSFPADDYDRGFYAAAAYCEVRECDNGTYTLTLTMPADPLYWSHRIRTDAE